MKPVIMYVDDEPQNLVVLEAALPDDWEIHTFDSPLKALDFAASNNVWIAMCDQRMPQMMGVKLLEIIKKTNPTTKRVLVTGYSDEDLIIESVRTAQVHDYIRKPWDVDDLEHRITKMIETYQLEESLRIKNEELEKQNAELRKTSDALRTAKEKEESLKKELEAWAPPFILSATENLAGKFPQKMDLAVITFDIVGSSHLHDVFIQNKLARTHIQQAFSEIVITHGGWRESSSGDSAYAHFGMLMKDINCAEAALAAASEFRVFLRNFCSKHGVQIECGVGLHMAKDCIVDVHTVQIMTPSGLVTQKSFDSSSSDIDLVHRLEKLTHSLPGSNIAMSKQFLEALKTQPPQLADLGSHHFKGQGQPTQVFAKLSDRVKAEDLSALQGRMKAA